MLEPRPLVQFERTRRQSLALCEGLSAEDMVAQSMPDASPTKWHLAHTTWFFEAFILTSHLPNYKPFNQDFHYLFNSYYESKGKRHARPRRGLLTRPSLAMVFAYREHVDQKMAELLAGPGLSPRVAELTVVGLHHEMQHQELILTDLLHLFSCNPLFPAVQSAAEVEQSASAKPAQFVAFDGGLVEIGTSPEAGDFAYDCESPRHKTWLESFALADRPVTNADWLEFMRDGGYEDPLLWLSDGWHCRQRKDWQAPGYWQKQDGQWLQFSLNGLRPVDLAAPVCHVSYYEADAFARWSGKQLPTEQQWEHAARAQHASLPDGNFLEARRWQPTAATRGSFASGLQQLYGDVWEWTQSPFSPYPGFQPEAGGLSEYNGKFMANQFVLRGGSCATPKQQMRPSYRNFFYPHQRWQFSGLRLADAVN